MMEFTCNGFVRWGFGFANPNHAAAALCAALPFLWGWRRRAWCGRTLTGVAFAALALTHSRTGFVVAALETAAWAWAFGLEPPGRRLSMAGARDARPYRNGRDEARPSRRAVVWGGLAVLAFAAAAGVGVAGRCALDDAVLNRPKIWWAGLKLAAANPWGVGHGQSGRLAAAFLLDGIEVRTLVNAHLTFLAEYGWAVGGAWLAFLAAAVFAGGRDEARPSRSVATNRDPPTNEQTCDPPGVWFSRMRVAFGGMVMSASASSVFDGHVLFGGGGLDGAEAVNFVLSWGLFAGFVAMGAWLIVQGRNRARHAHLSRRAAAGAAGALAVVLALTPTDGAPAVRGGFVVKGGTDTPLVLYGAEWPLAAVLPYLTDGYRLAIEPGCVEATGADLPIGRNKLRPSHGRGESRSSRAGDGVWLFGTCAESARRFPHARLTVVDPPEFCNLPPGTRVLR